MKFIEGFFIKKYTRGTKKGQEYIKNTKRYIWVVPKDLENEIELGDEVLVETTWLKNNEHVSTQTKVLVINIYEKDEELEDRKKVLKILKKNKSKPKGKHSGDKYSKKSKAPTKKFPLDKIS